MIIDPLYSATAAMSANAARLAVAAHNIANINTEGFRASTATIESNAAGLPVVTITQSTTAGPLIMMPEGLPGGEVYRALSNTSLAEEFVQMQLAEIGYKAGASIIPVQNEMIGTILDILA